MVDHCWRAKTGDGGATHTSGIILKQWPLKRIVAPDRTDQKEETVTIRTDKRYGETESVHELHACATQILDGYAAIASTHTNSNRKELPPSHLQEAIRTTDK